MSLLYPPRLLWSSTSHRERLQWTCSGTWRPTWRKGLKRSMVPQLEKDSWSAWMIWICQRQALCTLNQVSYLIPSFTCELCLNVFYHIIIQVDSYGTQQPIALLKLLLDRGGIYDRGKELNLKILKDLGFVAAMGKAGGGRNEVDTRFVSLFSVFSVPFPAVESLHLIYASIIKGHTRVSTTSKYRNLFLSHKYDN